MGQLPFIKMHGCGNDYVFIDCFAAPAPPQPQPLAVQLSDRHTGIGSDGLVLMLPSKVADARMQMFNSDGSEGAMCGNAIRCITMWLHQHHSPAQTSFRIETQSRIVETSVIESHTAEQKAVVRVNMGPASEARLNTNTSPSNANSAIRSADALVRQTVVSNVMIAEKPVVASCVSMGNPHAVIFVSTLDEINFAENGPAIEHHTLFPDRTNVEFVQVLDRHRAKVRVWERGSGETMACGSGACAVAVAGIAYGAFPDNQPVSIQMRGGVLQIEWPDRKNVFMQGPAEESFRGVVPTAFSGD